MKRQDIYDTLIYYKDNDGSFIVESPLFTPVIGVGESFEEAEDVFHRLFNYAWIEYLENNVAGYIRKVGRPNKKRSETIHCSVSKETKIMLNTMLKNKTLSYGDFITYLIHKEFLKSD